MLKAVITCLQDISESLVTELVRNHVKVLMIEVCDGETPTRWLERVSACIREQGVQEKECLLVASDRELLQCSAERNLKCIGYVSPNGHGTDLFGCCTM